MIYYIIFSKIYYINKLFVHQLYIIFIKRDLIMIFSLIKITFLLGLRQIAAEPYTICYNTRCQTCSKSSDQGDDTCLSCKTDLGRSKVSDNQYCPCGDGYFATPTDFMTCAPCHFSCLSCRNSDIDGCYTCDSNSYRVLSNKVHLTCPCEYTAKGCNAYTTASNVCVSCQNFPNKADIPNCDDNSRIIFNGNTCDCSSNSYLVNSECVGCCDVSCGSCNGSSNTDCLTCSAGSNRVKTQNQCACQQPRFYDAGQQICPGCDYSCYTCNGISNTSCMSCSSDDNRTFSFYQNTCPCNPGYFDQQSHACGACHYSCKTCNGTAAGTTYTSCLSCNRKSYRYLSQNSCLCRYGYKDNGVALCGSISSCNYTCQTCKGTSCLTCDTNQHRVLSGKSCPCSGGYYNNGLSFCGTCDLRCLTCNDTTTTGCLTCNSKQFRALQNTSCLCETGYYDYGSATCGTCYFTCQTCIDSQKFSCVTCNATNMRTIQRGQCVCQLGYAENFKNAQCIGCDYSCLGCTGPSNTSCSICSPTSNRAFSNNTCLCNPGYFDNGVTNCTACNSACQTCTNTTNLDCLSCNATNFRIQQQTSCLCMPGYYDNRTACATCSYACLTCTNATATGCMTCDTKNFRSSRSNSCPCNSGYFDAGNAICGLCSFACLTCNKPTTKNCLSCNAQDFRVLIRSSCLCKPGFFENSTAICGTCSSTCQTCANSSSTSCSSCNSKNFRYLSMNSCLCKSGYLENSNGTCQIIPLVVITCDFSCKTCKNITNTSCSTCNAANFRILKKSSCLCKPGYFEINTASCGGIQLISFIQIVCDSSCYTCSGLNNTNCLSCDPKTQRSFFSNNNTCLCKRGYQDIGSQLCQQIIICDITCQTCKDRTIYGCLTCNGSFPYFRSLTTNNQCLCNQGYKNSLKGSCVPQNCAMNQYFDQVYQQCGRICQITYLACLKTCLTCSGPNKFQCLSCDSSTSRSLQNGQCLCPTGYLAQDNLGTCSQKCLVNQFQKDGQCFNCHPLCSRCDGLSALDCTACKLQNYDELDTGQNIHQYYQNSQIFLNLNEKSYICANSVSKQVQVAAHDGAIKVTVTATNINTNRIEFVQTFYNFNVIIPKQTLQCGQKYMVDVDVKEAHNRILQADQQQQTQTFNTSFIMEIIFLQKIIILSGGNRLIGNSEDFVIGCQIFDFNNHDSPIENLTSYTFTWTCTLVGQNTICLTKRGQILNTESITNYLQVSAIDLAPYISYSFEVIVYDSIGQSNYNASVVYQVLDQNIPQMNVTYDANILAIPVNLNLLQQFQYIYPLQINPDNLFYSANLLYNFDVVATIIYHYPTVNFRIWDYFQNFTNSSGIRISFVGQVYNPQYLIPSLLTIGMNVNIPPQRCQISVSPNAGVELLDLFMIQVLNCHGDTSKYSHRFAYYQSQGDFDHDNLLQSLARACFQTSFQPSNMLNTYLPKGLDGSDIILMIAVKDSLGGISNYTQNVQVTPIQNLNENDIIRIINNLTDTASQLRYFQVISASLMNLNQSFPIITPLITQLLSIVNNSALTQEQQNQVIQIQAFTSTQISDLGTLISSQQSNNKIIIQQIIDSIAFSQANPSAVLNQQTHDALINLNTILDSQQILGTKILQNLNSQLNQSDDKNSTQFQQINLQNQLVLQQLNQSRLIKIQQMTPNDGTKLLINEQSTTAVAFTTQKILTEMMGQNIVGGTQNGILASDVQNQTRNTYTFSYLQLNSNPYTSDPSYPYADQGFSVVDLQITKQTKSSINSSDLQKSGNIVPSQQVPLAISQGKLQTNKTNTTGPKSNASKVCVSLVKNKWSAEECQTVTTKGEISCRCNTINPTSAVQDTQGLFSGANTQIFSTPALGSVAKFPWQKVTLLWIIAFITVIYLIMLPVGFKRDKEDKINKAQMIDHIRKRNIILFQTDPFNDKTPLEEISAKIIDSNTIDKKNQKNNKIIEVEILDDTKRKQFLEEKRQQFLNNQEWINIKQNQLNQFKSQVDLGTIITTPSTDRQYDYIIESPSCRSHTPDQIQNNEKSQLEQLEKEKNANMTFIQYFLIHHTYLNIYNSYEDLHRPIRASLIYLALLQSLAVTLYFGSSLTIVRAIILGVLCSVASTINITLLKALLSSKFMALRIFGILLFTSLAGFMIFVILAVIATTESIAQTNAWSIQYCSSIVYDGTIGSIATLLIKYKFFR